MTDNTNKKKKKHIARNICLTLGGALIVGAAIPAVSFGCTYFSAKENNVIAPVTSNVADTDNSDVNDISELTDVAQTSNAEMLAKYVDISDMVEEAVKSVVAVNCVEYQQYGGGYYGYMYGQGGTREVPSCGTGIIVSLREDDMLILTNNHVVEGADKVSVVFVNDTEVDARVLGTAEDSDIALVAVSVKDIDEETMKAVSIAMLGDSDNVRVGSAAIAIGNALGYGQSVTTGVISALNREVELVDTTLGLIQTDAPINSGNSGGPLLNANGEVIGVNSVKYASTGVEGMGYAIPINTVKPIIEEILNPTETEVETNTDKAYLGIYGMTITWQYQFMYGFPQGVYITEVEADSPAGEAGLSTGDIITSLEGIEITSMEELAELLAKYKPGDTVTLGVKVLKRNSYKSTAVEVVLGSLQE
ncbi:MAG: trypsin-like peptidase domain-containing protein [Lachnospiraceae bacterium]|nr:trypsin-like peptidase domain-containing protein [Lachnospiraceae bacterium]